MDEGRLHNDRIERRADIGAPKPARWGPALVVVIVGTLAVIGAVAALVLAPEDEESAPVLVLPSEVVGPDPLSFEVDRTSAYERAAAFGLSHVLFERSPGGVVASARRTAAFRGLVEDAAERGNTDADLLEAMVFLESAGRPDVIAGSDVENAAGLTQILAETATNFLDMDVDVEASRELTRRIEDARRLGDAPAVRRLRAERRQVDARFDPAEALAGSVRYLTEARRHFGREDLAVVSYHMGIGNLESVLRAYSGDEDAPIDEVVDDEGLDYARIYFDASPTSNRDAWELLASFGDDSQTYYWRVLAAAAIMRTFREDPARLERLAELHGRGPSAELVLHPPDRTRRFAEPGDLADARRTGALKPLQSDPALPYEVGPQVGRLATRIRADAALYRMLRPRALALLEYLTTQVRLVSGAERPLRVTAAAYDETYAGVLSDRGADAATHPSVHTTGFSFDIRRRYESGAQAEAFQYTLERLEALGLIAWMRGERVIHVTVSPRAAVRARP
jgi:hypothetical protein